MERQIPLLWDLVINLPSAYFNAELGQGFDQLMVRHIGCFKAQAQEYIFLGPLYRLTLTAEASI